MKKIRTGLAALVLGILLSVFLPAAGTNMLPGYGTASAEDDWKAEFDDTCARTEDAMALSVDELKALIERCDRIKPMIERLEGPQRKVYLKRLQMCRDLFSFALESKEKSGK